MRPLALLIALGLPLGASAAPAVETAGERVAAKAAPPPAGRYRCYQPPNYKVTAWFDLEADGRYRVQSGEAGRFDWDARRSLLRWRGGDFAAGRAVGIYMPPGAKHGDQERATIVLAPRDGIRPGGAGWDRLQRCYLTTH